MQSPHHDPSRRPPLARSVRARVPRVVLALACLLALGLGLAPAVHANSVRQLMVVNGTTIIDETTTRSGSMSINQSRSSNTYDGRMTGNVFQGGEVGAFASISGTVNAQTAVTAKGYGSYRLTRPAGARRRGRQGRPADGAER